MRRRTNLPCNYPTTTKLNFERVACINEFHGVQTHINTMFLLFSFLPFHGFEYYFFYPWKMLFTLTSLAYWVLFLERTTDDKCPIISAISLSKLFDGLQSTVTCGEWSVKWDFIMTNKPHLLSQCTYFFNTAWTQTGASAYHDAAIL